MLEVYKVNEPYLKVIRICNIHRDQSQLQDFDSLSIPPSTSEFIMAFAQPPHPKSALGYYRMLSPTAAIRVSTLCLGGMNFGESW